MTAREKYKFICDMNRAHESGGLDGVKEHMNTFNEDQMDFLFETMLAVQLGTYAQLVADLLVQLKEEGVSDEEIEAGL